MSSQGSVRQRHNARCPVDPAGGHTPHRCRGTWWWVLDLGPDPLTGKRRQPSKSGFATRREAQVDLAAARATLAVTKGRGAGLTVGAWLDDWLASLHTASPTTTARYEGILRLHLKPILGQLLLADLAPEHVDRLLRTVASPGYVAPGLDRRHQATAGPQSSASVKRIFAVLRRALVVAARRRLIPWNPAAAVEPPEETNKPGTAWTPEQAGRFLDSTNGERLGAAWRLAVTTGARRAELCGATWDRIDLAAAVWRIDIAVVQVGSTLHEKSPKTRRGTRVVALDAETVTALRTYRERQDDECATAVSAGTWDGTGRVFTGPDGLGITPAGLSSAWRAAVRRVRKEHPDLPAVRLHDARHTANTLARLYAGLDPKVLLERMGHTGDPTNQRYTHVHEGVHRQAAEAIADVLRPHLGRTDFFAPGVDPANGPGGPSPEKSHGGSPPRPRLAEGTTRRQWYSGVEIREVVE